MNEKITKLKWREDIDYLSPEEFEILANFIYHKSGIKLEGNKTYLLNNRIQKRLRELQIKSPGDYIRILKYSDKDGFELQELLNLVTVNETFFFRDFPQLESFVECLKNVVERKMQTNDNTMRIWCAGCSTGEEPYTLSIILNEILDNVAEWKLHILASDIDKSVLARAEIGIYEERSVKDVPEEYMSRYFKRDMHKKTSKVNEGIRSIIQFEHLNLSDREKMRAKRNYDFIFCRNVLIYFDDTSRQRVVNNFYSTLNPKGYIFLGSSESMGRITSAFKLIRLNKHLVYCKE